jgi:hypothetical protein
MRRHALSRGQAYFIEADEPALIDGVNWFRAITARYPFLRAQQVRAGRGRGGPRWGALTKAFAAARSTTARA